MVTRRLLDFASELVEEILFHVDLHVDLINFACTCKLAASFVIPRHSEYRVLVFGDLRLALWAHLASRPDFTRNLRKISFTPLQERSKCRLPRDFRSSCTSADEDATPEQLTRYARDMQKAFSYMQDLEELLIAAGNGVMIAGVYSPALLGAIVARKPRLRMLAIRHGSSFDKLCESGDIRGDANYLTGLSHLHLSLGQGPKEPIPVGLWAQNARRLVYLSMPSDCFHSPLSIQMPCLQTLRIYRASVQDSSSTFPDFLKQHPTIEDLSWFPTNEVVLRPGTLPRLKVLLGTMSTLRALESSYSQLAEDATTPPEKYRIECLSILHGTIETISSFKCFDWTSLRTFDFHNNLESPESLSLLARMCPQIHTLCFPMSWGNGSWTQQTLLIALSQFAQLVYLPTRAIWSFIDCRQQQEVTDLVVKLGLFCPELKWLPWWNNSYADEDPKDVLIVRKRTNSGINVSYSLEPAEPRHEFDPLHMFFHDSQR
ncbi:hypothetical protein BDN72DRAFT_964154 [Pluteus cervinus]|uniref:Uncharacterized protein n=1 Tax=Pluteus cervinus TaxID=181527 RepID=A0ACD3AE11_9AGAR|nr:hypothetical protein BDN72DRAFT_964154 [Pluteus cervinus]